MERITPTTNGRSKTYSFFSYESTSGDNHESHQNTNKLSFDHNTKLVSDVLEQLNECLERVFGPLAQQMIDSSAYANLPSHLTFLQLSVFTERHIRSNSLTHDHRKKTRIEWARNRWRTNYSLDVN